MIGFIDSGVGGINVLVECAKIYKEDFVYLADNKNSPYGNLPKKQLYEITKHNIKFLIEKYNVGLVVLACNTTSASVGEKLQAYFNVPIVLTKPCAKEVEKLEKPVLFFGTKNTIKNNKEIQNFIKNKNNYKSLYIANLPKIIDQNISKPNNVLPFLKQNIGYKKYKEIKTICLCCTHFKLIKKQLKYCFIQNIKFYEYEKEVAKKSLNYIKNNNKEKSTFKIVLTQKDEKLYLSIKKYMIKKLNGKFDK